MEPGRARGAGGARGQPEHEGSRCLHRGAQSPTPSPPPLPLVSAPTPPNGAVQAEPAPEDDSSHSSTAPTAPQLPVPGVAALRQILDFVSIALRSLSSPLSQALSISCFLNHMGNRHMLHFCF